MDCCHASSIWVGTQFRNRCRPKHRITFSSLINVGSVITRRRVSDYSRRVKGQFREDFQHLATWPTRKTMITIRSALLSCALLLALA